MQMNIQVTSIFILIVSHKDSFCHRVKSKLGIGLFIHELLREPLIITQNVLTSFTEAREQRRDVNCRSLALLWPSFREDEEESMPLSSKR